MNVEPAAADGSHLEMQLKFGLFSQGQHTILARHRARDGPFRELIYLASLADCGQEMHVSELS